MTTAEKLRGRGSSLVVRVLVRNRREGTVAVLDRCGLDEGNRIAAGEAVLERRVELAVDGLRRGARRLGPFRLEFFGDHFLLEQLEVGFLQGSRSVGARGVL